MPWKDTHPMDQRIEFAMKAVNCLNFAELCAEYGISRKTGYKWRERFVAQGIEGMEEESRRPHAHSEELPEAVLCRIVGLKLAHPHWGPRKIRELYWRKHATETPSESSFKRVLERVGLTQRRKRRQTSAGGRLSSGRKAAAPNEIWSVDFKGWWRSANGDRIDPLTVRDEHSRMILAIQCVDNGRTETVRACFEELYRRHGLPAAIRSDNGSPFASHQGLLGLSRLSAWWLALGIDLERSRPGCPQDNGAHERMHLDIRRELEAGRMGRDQAAFDLWRHQYNTERPHEALRMAVPAEIYRPSDRPYEGTPEHLDYGAMDTRRVNSTQGTIRYRGEHIAISTALGGWDVGLAPQPDGEVEVWFAKLLVGHIQPKTSSFIPTAPPGNGKGRERRPAFWPVPLRSTGQNTGTQQNVTNPTQTCSP
jgi:transposase InsO family protein